MANAPSTEISSFLVLSIPAFIAILTGVGTFLKSLWDRWSEQRSLIGLQKLTDYIDIDNKRDLPLLTVQTRSLINREINLRLREFAGAPASDAVEKVERWRRKPGFIRIMWIPPEVLRAFLPRIEVKAASSGKIKRVVYKYPRVTRAMYIKLLLITYASFVMAWAYIYYFNISVAGFRPGILHLRKGQVLIFVVIWVSLVGFTILTSLLAEADRIAREFVMASHSQVKVSEANVS